MATLIGTNSNNNLTGTSSADTIVGRAGNDQLVGNGGNDRLNGGTQNDVLNGGSGTDTADYSNLVIGGITYIGATAGVTVNLNIASAQNTGGAGSDTLVSIENLIGTDFDDKLAGNGAANVLTGLGGRDIMAGAAGNDQLSGGDGNDLLNGGTGNDLLNGGAGIDSIDYGPFVIGGQTVSGGTAGVTINLSLTGAQDTVGAGTDTLVGIENVYGSSFNDTLTGNSADNVLTGRVGNDTLIGGAGNDLLRDDTGDDLLDGGTGIDTASYASATAGVTVDLDLGGPQNTVGAGTDTLVSIEILTGSKFNDRLIGTYTENATLNGGDGNDTLGSSRGNAITLNGGVGDDLLWNNDGDGGTLNGGAGDDRLSVSEGDAFTLNGGDGNDVLTVYYDSLATLNGGAGADTLEHDAENGDHAFLTFDYNSVSESPVGAGKDTIIGFTSSMFDGDPAGDQIDLTDIDANTIVSGNQAFTYIGSAAFTAAGQLRYAGGLLQGSTDADTAAEFEIQLVGAPTLTVGGAGTDILL